MSWEAVIGLEVHVQLATNSKIFSGAATAFGAEPNAQACPVDLGLPGVLPVLNREAVAMAVKFGLAIGARVHTHSIFDRKNYFYPDLPKGYQISQFKDPVVGEGQLDVTLADGSVRTIGITRAHLEEDAGKSVHDAYPRLTAIDLNRTGTPLLEVVSEPDMRTPAEASAYFRQLASLVRYLGICDGNLAQGSMRCDANVSVRPVGEQALGQRTEVKNINSFRFVERAVAYEIERQIDVLEAGGTIERETRLYDANADETRAMRGKEMSADYRYFPDPDLLPLVIEQSFIEQVRADLPELPAARRLRYETDLGVTAELARQLTDDPEVAAFFETTAEVSGHATQSANWVINDLAAKLNQAELEISASPVTALSLGQLIQRIEDGTLSSKTAKTVFDALWDGAEEVDQVIDAKGLKQLNDSSAIEAMVREVVDANPAQVAQFKAGKDKVLGFFVGQVMQASQGKANPQQVNELVRKLLRE